MLLQFIWLSLAPLLVFHAGLILVVSDHVVLPHVLPVLSKFPEFAVDV